MIALLLSQWKTAGLVALLALLALLLALWRIEAGHARKLAQQAAAAQAADRQDQAKAAASQAAEATVDRGADRDTHTLTLHTENTHAIEAAAGFGQGLDPGLNAAGRRGLCGFAAYQADPACVQLRGPDPGGRPQAGGADGPAAP
jgi:hypothetical protein